MYLYYSYLSDLLIWNIFKYELLLLLLLLLIIGQQLC